MLIEQSKAVLRPRSSSEAIDLGFLMARRWFVPLWKIWFSLAFPVFVLAHLFLNDYMMLAILVFWWFKPLYEIRMTSWLGKALFSKERPESPGYSALISQLKPGLLAHLTWRRLSPSRSFNYCVHMLEGLKGSALGKRLTSLHTTNPGSGWLTIILVHIEGLFQIAIPFLILLFTPQYVLLNPSDLMNLIASPSMGWINNISYFVVASLIAPFYIAAGFSLYINSRTDLEAWDLELDFKRMDSADKPLGQSAAAVIVLALFISLIPQQSLHAMPTQTEAKEIITEVLKGSDFGETKTQTTWKSRDEADEDTGAFEENSMTLPSNTLSTIGSIIKYASLVVTALAIIWIVYNIARNLDYLGFNRKYKAAVVSRPTLKLLDDKEQEEIPLNPVQPVLDLIQQGELRKALSLLYRSTLLNYIEIQQVEIPDSATEGECLKIICNLSGQEEAGFFSHLTHQWQWLAYAGQPIEATAILQLCEQWPRYYTQRDPGS